MEKYLVTFSTQLEVEADNEAEAEWKATEIAANEPNFLTLDNMSIEVIVMEISEGGEEDES